jgi:hypothetical protein
MYRPTLCRACGSDYVGAHWEKSAHSLLTGAILHVLYAEEEKTLARDLGRTPALPLRRVTPDDARLRYGDPCHHARRLRVLRAPRLILAPGAIRAGIAVIRAASP